MRLSPGQGPGLTMGVHNRRMITVAAAPVEDKETRRQRGKRRKAWEGSGDAASREAGQAA